MKNPILAVSILVLSVLAVATFVQAGSLSPSANPAGTMYTLNDIYIRLTDNTAATEGNHNLSSALSPVATMHTLKEIYEAIPTIAADTVKAGTTYLGVAGTLTPAGGTAGVADLFRGKTSHVTGDWDLDTGTLDLACNTATFDGAGNRVSDAYDGSGNGTDRWCVTDSGDAAASDIVSGKKAWVDGVEITGNASAGVTYGDNNAAKVLSTASAAGTALTAMYNGRNTSNSIPGGTQELGGVDDYLGGDTYVNNRYKAVWTLCTAANNYCGTGSAMADARDENTGLVWSYPCNGSGCSSFSESAPGYYTWTSGGGNNGGKTASQLCSSAVGWNLPHQKQLLMAYIDGSHLNLHATDAYWSATTNSSNLNEAWYTSLRNGYTTPANKGGGFYVRCVRFSPTN